MKNYFYLNISTG